MNTQDNFPEVVSGRITTRAKKLMEKYQKFRKDYLENLSVGVCRLQEQYLV